MSHPLFDLIEKSGFLRKDEVNLSLIERLSTAEIIDFAERSLEVTSVREHPGEKSIFSHSASLSLSGGRWPCSSLNCRLARAQELAQFAALFSDRVYINNFLGDHAIHPEVEDSLDDTIRWLRQRNFAEDLVVFIHLRPLIEAGRIIPISPPEYCPHCLAPRSLGKADDRRLRKAFRRLIDRYNKDLSVSLERSGDLYTFTARGPEILFEHGFSSFTSLKSPDNLDQMPRIKKQVESGKEVTLSKTAYEKLDLESTFFGPVYRNLKYELATSQCLNSSLLSERVLDIEFLKDLSEDPDLALRNHIMEKHLTCLVPFLDDVHPSDLVRLRNQEEEAFVLFRRALSRAIDEQKSQKNLLSERDAKALYHDLIEPQLSLIDAKVKAARRQLIKGTRRKLLGWTAAISFGIFTGFLPTGLAAAAALGLTKILAEFLEDLMTKSDAEETIRSQEMFFLWKVKKARRSY